MDQFLDRFVVIFNICNYLINIIPTGKSNTLPTSLDNSMLFYQSNLRTNLIIGVDYELVGYSIACYIERIYGLKNNSIILSTCDFTSQPMYRTILQSVLLHRNFTMN